MGTIGVVGALLSIVACLPAAGGPIPSEIAGTVRGLNARPLGGITVRIFDHSTEGLAIATAHTDAVGRYAAAVPPGRYKVRFADARVSGYYDTQWYSGRDSFTSATTVGVDSGQSIVIDADLLGPPPPGPTDLALQRLSVDQVYRLGEPIPYARLLTTVVHNDGPGTVRRGALHIMRCPTAAVGDCVRVAELLRSRPGRERRDLNRAVLLQCGWETRDRRDSPLLRGPHTRQRFVVGVRRHPHVFARGCGLQPLRER